MEDIKKNQMGILELKNTINKIKSSVDGLKQQNGGDKGKISDLENKNI